MLGRLIQTAASYGKGNAALESATEEAHTRNLLYGQSQHVYSLAQSPPGSPFAGPSFRPGTFDDRGGLELEEKDLRVLVAQDAFGADEKPTLLFDSNATTSPNQHSTHARHASITQPGPRSPLPNDWRPRTPLSPNNASTDSTQSFRNRSLTISGSPSAWTKPVRDAGTREEAFLECMFGVVSSTKTTSTTKMHVVPGGPRSNNQTPNRSNTTPDSSEHPGRRAPLMRSRTSGITSRTTHPSLPGLDTEGTAHDAVLVTRLFNVALPEMIANTTNNQAESSSVPTNNQRDEQPALSEPLTSSGQQSKKPKLVERKVPAFAIGLVVYLPRTSDTRPAPTRPGSRSAHAHTLSSASSSYGSDLQNSWTFLNAIPESLASSKASNDDHDRRIEVIVNNWDVILRTISSLERQASVIIYEQLDQILNQASGLIPKTPMEKSMQRINQRIVSITDPSVIARRPSLQRAAKHSISRVCYALRTPRVVTGLGFAAGHWSDEARMLHRICGRRQHNFFLFNLLTAFLGNHTQWLQRLAPEWYRKQYRSTSKRRPESHLLTQRTVIIADQRSIARRLIFILASFFPGSAALDGLHKLGEDPLFAGPLSASSPSSQLTRNESLRRTANKRMRDYRLQSNANDKVILSTSASSAESVSLSASKEKPQRSMVRQNSDAISIHGSSRAPGLDPETHLRKSAAGTTSVTTPNPATPVAYFATKGDSYFPDGSIADNNESIASADLAKLLRRSSSSGGTSSNVSSRWGSLMSGISDLWTPRDYPTDVLINNVAGSRFGINNSPTRSSRAPVSLQAMKNEVSRNPTIKARSSDLQNGYRSLASPEEYPSPARVLAAAPQLKVDDRDGVIDVDLDLPGFSRFHIDDFGNQPARRSHRSSMINGMDGAESIRSLRSMPNSSPKAQTADETSAAGYLKRFHEDFVLHATRPYTELEGEIRRSMSMEPSPPPDWITQVDTPRSDGWTRVCTTLIADVRTFSLRRLTLRRKFVNREGMDGSSVEPLSPGTDKVSRKSNWAKVEEEFVEEEVKDFDTLLADAIERALNIVDTMQPTTMRSPRLGHSRTASSSTTMTSRLTPPGASIPDLNFVHVSQEYVKQDCRQVVMGALEEVVKDVNNDLSKLQRGRDIQGARSFDIPAVKAEMKQENILREGVKQWLLNVEQTRVW